MFKVFQIILTKKDNEQINHLGWNGAAETNPKIASYLDKMKLNSNLEAVTFKYFTHVANANTQRLDDVFEMGQNFKQTDSYEIIISSPSISVGDIIQDIKQNKYYVVCNFGFKEVKV